MSSNEDEHNVSDAHNVFISQKRKVRQQCNICRRKKILCDGSGMSGTSCSNCINYGFDCIYFKPARKDRVPSDRYVKSLESRLQKMEELLHKLYPIADGETSPPKSMLLKPVRPSVRRSQEGRMKIGHRISARSRLQDRDGDGDTNIGNVMGVGAAAVSSRRRMFLPSVSSDFEDSDPRGDSWSSEDARGDDGLVMVNNANISSKDKSSGSDRSDPEHSTSVGISANSTGEILITGEATETTMPQPIPRVTELPAQLPAIARESLEREESPTAVAPPPQVPLLLAPTPVPVPALIIQDTSDQPGQPRIPIIRSSSSPALADVMPPMLSPALPRVIVVNPTPMPTPYSTPPASPVLPASDPQIILPPRSRISVSKEETREVGKGKEDQKEECKLPTGSGGSGVNKLDSESSIGIGAQSLTIGPPATLSLEVMPGRLPATMGNPSLSDGSVTAAAMSGLAPRRKIIMVSSSEYSTDSDLDDSSWTSEEDKIKVTSTNPSYPRTAYSAVGEGAGGPYRKVQLIAEPMKGTSKRGESVFRGISASVPRNPSGGVYELEGRTLRMQMLRMELTEDLRQNLLWERQMSKARIAELRGRSTRGVAGRDGANIRTNIVMSNPTNHYPTTATPMSSKGRWAQHTSAHAYAHPHHAPRSLRSKSGPPPHQYQTREEAAIRFREAAFEVQKQRMFSKVSKKNYPSLRTRSRSLDSTLRVPPTIPLLKTGDPIVGLRSVVAYEADGHRLLGVGLQAKRSTTLPFAAQEAGYYTEYCPTERDSSEWGGWW